MTVPVGSTVFAPEIKSAKITGGDFSGTPYVASVAFATSFPNGNYSLAFSARTTGSLTGTILYTVSAQDETGFTVQLIGLTLLTNLDSIQWTAIQHLDP